MLLVYINKNRRLIHHWGTNGDFIDYRESLMCYSTLEWNLILTAPWLVLE